MLKAGLLIVLTSTTLAGCTLPRGAALQSEILAAQTDENGNRILPDMDIIAIDRTTVAKIGQWPQLGQRNAGWLSRKKQPPSLLISPGDQIEVTVWDADENSLVTAPGQRSVSMKSMKVAATGQVFLPFVGAIKVAGLTPDIARAQIETAYLASIPSAQVQLSVQPGRSNTANLVAGVANPGVYPLDDRDVTILSLLAMGGGVPEQLINPQVKLVRDGKTYSIALDKLYENSSLDTTLRGGDRVIVEADQRVFLALGSAGSQSRQIFPKDDISALDALAIMGGVNANRANPKGILILRNYPQKYVRADGIKGPSQKRNVFVMDLTTADGMFSAGEFKIMPDDVVYVTESPVNAARTVMGLMGSAFGLADLANN